MKKTILILFIWIVSAQAQLQNYLQALQPDSLEVLINRPTSTTNFYNNIFLEHVEFTDSLMSSVQKYGKNAGNYATLASAVTAASDDTSTLIVSDRFNITTATTISGTAALVVQQGGRFNLTRKLTISIPFTAGPYQIFEGTLDSLEFSSGAVDKIYAEWFGNDLTTDASQEINAALKAAPNGVKVQLLEKTYVILSPILMKDSAILEGISWKGSIIQTGGAVNGINIGDGTNANEVDNAILQNFTLDGDNTGVYGVNMLGTATNICTDNTLRNVRIFDFDSVGVRLEDWALSNNFYNVQQSGSKYGIQLIDRANDNTFFECGVGNNTADGILIDATNDGIRNSFYGCISFSNATGLQTTGSAGAVLVSGCYFENNSGITIDHNSSSGQITVIGCHLNGNNATSSVGIEIGSHAYIAGNNIVGGATNMYDSSAVHITSGSRNYYVGPNRYGAVSAGAVLIDNDSGLARQGFVWDAEQDSTIYSTDFIVKKSGSPVFISVNGAESSLRQFQIEADDTLRWVLRATADSSDFLVLARDDTGGIASNVLFADRTTGNITMGSATSRGGRLNVEDGNLVVVDSDDHVQSNNMISATDLYISADQNNNEGTDFISFGHDSSGSNHTELARISAVSTDSTLTVTGSGDFSGNVNIDGKLNVTGAVDPPAVSYSKETFASIRELSRGMKDDQKYVTCFINDRMMVYFRDTDTFYSTPMTKMIE